MKLLEKFRWLPTEMPWPGTAEVSAKSWLLAVLVGDTPGTSSARSRRLRPLSGRDLTSVCETVPATWVRAVSSNSVSPLTVTLVSGEATECECVRRQAIVAYRIGANEDQVLLARLRLREIANYTTRTSP
jgi:hypothetical protein